MILKNAYNNVHKIKFGVLLKMNKNAEINKIVMMMNIKLFILNNVFLIVHNYKIINI